MFIRMEYSGYRGTEQVSAGQYMILIDDGSARLYAMAGRVAMRQLGNFMMGRFRIGNRWISVSGSCGSDGLPIGMDKIQLRHLSRMVELPAELAARYWRSDGWNDAGSATDALVEWGRSTFKVLGKKRRVW